VKLVAMSRREIEAADLTADSPCVAICIAYPTGRLHKVAPIGSLRAVLHLRFSDCDGEGRWSFPEAKDDQVAMPMTRGQAIDVIDFVNKWRGEVSTIYAACYGGISRSRGILAGLASIHGWNDANVYAGGHPNVWCKVLIQRAARKEAT